MTARGTETDLPFLARETETDQTASRTEAKAGETRTGAGRETDTRREIGHEKGSDRVTETVIETETEIVAATEIKRTRKCRCPASNSNMSLR